MKILRKVSLKETKEFIKNLDLENPELYSQINSDTLGIFQMSGATASSMCKKIHPDNFDEIVSLNALSRPGSSFGLDDFIASKKTGAKKYPPIFDDVLKDSHGIILFQEQIMIITEMLSNKRVSGNDCRKLLKTLGKANPPEEAKEKWLKYVSIMKEEGGKLGLSSSDIESITNDMLTLSKYSFNKSHAYCYSVVAMETLYLSNYYKPYFYSANLIKDASKTDGLLESFRNVSSRYKILPPDVNKSSTHFQPNGGKDIMFGLGEIKGVGENSLDAIKKNRPYTSVIDFICKNINEKTINKRITMALINGGAFDSLIKNGEKGRTRTAEVADAFYTLKKQCKNVELLKEKWDVCEDSVPYKESSSNEILALEQKYLGGNFFHSIFSPEILEKINVLVQKGRCFMTFQDVIDNPYVDTRYVPVMVNSYKYWSQKDGKQMIFLNCSDCTGEEVSFPIFNSQYEFIKTKFYGEGFYMLSLCCKPDWKDSSKQVIAFGSKSYVRDGNRITSWMIPWRQ